MGFFDLAAPALEWLDALLGALPAALRLTFWGVVSGVASMVLYGWISPQQRIARGKQEQLELRNALESFDGDMGEAWPMLRRLLGLAFRQVGRVLLPAVLASLPVLFVLVWVSNSYGYHFPPPGETPTVSVSPQPLAGSWQVKGNGVPAITVRASDAVVGVVELGAPVPVVEKRHGWNRLIGNPAGYLEPDGPIERVEVELPEQEVLPFGPGWLRSWAATFFVALIAASLLTRRLLNIH